ncbi:thiol reductant ABC exporter subunit CydC [Marinospirillum insulare]|uniref:Cysteine/glutathione ABC transporter ATP-binding protein/permease CydC n=1 Tax=Marinospirillum insulare TaxID=217169 RepID=A0ABQ5ZZQ3_9GAMM|nr:thiol reductant ABC exporter subunit CydC [Marinospirillum insulare]GLR64793.1 cysteine/glutathione ABC transporter ATP-binding protein/permease CydC [Marinospirillum insulare]
MHPLKPWLDLMLQDKKRLLVGALLIFITYLSAIGLLALSGWFITATGVTALAWAAGIAINLDIYSPGGGIRFFALTRTVARYTERVYNHDTVLQLLARLRVRLFKNLTLLDDQTAAKFRASQWVNRLITDVDTLDNLYLRLLAPPLVALVTLIFVIVFLAFFHLQLAGLAALMLLLTLAVSTWGMAQAGKAVSYRLVSQQEAQRSLLVEQVEGLGELQASHSLSKYQQQLIAAQEVEMRDQQRLQQVTAWGAGLQTLLLQLTVAACLLLAAQAYQQGWLSGPMLVLIPLALMAMQEVFVNLPTAFASWGSTLAAAQRLNKTENLQSHLLSSNNPQALPTNFPLHSTLLWQGVSVKLGSQQVFTHINLQLKPGEKLALLGESGLGKSTLARLAARLSDPQAGAMLVEADGKQLNLKDLSLTDWQAQIGYLTQQSDLFATSIAENLRLAKADATDDELWAVLELVDLQDEVAAFPEQLNTWVGETGRQLSGGQARRLALARVILKDPALVILDEPFSSLDLATQATIRPRLEAWLKNRTALLLAHDLKALPECNRHIHLQDLLASQ